MPAYRRPDKEVIETQSGVAGVGDSATVPSAVAIALFAAIATWPIAKHGFRRDEKRDA